jgi:hypothetical protein
LLHSILDELSLLPSLPPTLPPPPAVLETPQMLYNALMCDGVEEDAPDMDTMHLSAPLPLPSANEHTAPEGGDQKSSYEICREKVSTTTTTTTFRENLTCVEDKEG